MHEYHMRTDILLFSQVKPKLNGTILNPYPDQVKFLLGAGAEEVCREPPLALATVVTAPANWERRHFIRNTWGHPSLTQMTGIKPVFMVGQTKDSKAQVYYSSYNYFSKISCIKYYGNISEKQINCCDYTPSVVLISFIICFKPGPVIIR